MIKVALPYDWMVVFNPPDTNASGTYLFPGDTVKNTSNVAVICPFRIINKSVDARAVYRVYESPANGRWNYSDKLILQPQTGTGVSYQIEFTFPQGILPTTGDTLWVVTDKPVTSNDRFVFTPDASLAVEGPSVPGGYLLSQNYPNPFNPNTVIRFQVPGASEVSLRVYDVLGREVAVLLNEEKKPGVYSVMWNATKIPSGMYLYRLQAGEYVATKKLILLR
jgi:hypothetical protein